MRQHTLATVALVVVVVLTGCSGPGQSVGDSSTGTDPPPVASGTPPATPTDAPTDAETATTTGAASPTSTATPTPSPTATPEPWTKPQTPNQPVDDKTDARAGSRIKNVTLVNTVSAENGSGYSNFDILVHANTSMENIDPPEYGTVEGEPYFLVYVDDQLLERSERVIQAENEEFTLDVRATGLDRFEAGEHRLTVKLMDVDSQYDDVYGVENKTVRLAPE